MKNTTVIEKVNFKEEADNSLKQKVNRYDTLWMQSKKNSIANDVANALEEEDAETTNDANNIKTWYSILIFVGSIFIAIFKYFKENQKRRSKEKRQEVRLRDEEYCKFDSRIRKDFDRAEKEREEKAIDKAYNLKQLHADMNNNGKCIMVSEDYDVYENLEIYAKAHAWRKYDELYNQQYTKVVSKN